MAVSGERPAARRPTLWRQLLLFFSIVGPGIITANADNDVGGIQTYSIAGAQFGYSMLWLLVPVTVALIVTLLNGVLLPVVLVLMLLLINNKVLMGRYTNNVAFNVVAWATVIIVGLLTAVSTVQQFFPGASGS